MNANHFKTDAEWLAAFHAQMKARELSGGTPPKLQHTKPVPITRTTGGLAHTKPLPIRRPTS